MRGSGRVLRGTFFLTNIQQLYEREDKEEDVNPVDDLLGPVPPSKDKMAAGPSLDERIAALGDKLMVLNDEAHHTWDEDSEWNAVIRRLNESAPLVQQLDMSATPRFEKGTLFPLDGLRLPA